MRNISDILGNNGLLAKVISGFVPRDSQIKMAETIEKVIHGNAQVIIEAGTGTGKTFAYLVPIFLSEKKTLISTDTRNLQDQLFLKDIPALNKVLPSHRKIVLLKGRSNYLCRYRLEKNLQDGRFVSKQQVASLYSISEWAAITKTGDISELSSIAEDSQVWYLATSTADNCLNQECPFYKNCFVIKARQDALAADIVVINHHLFFADMILQEEGFGELLPGAEILVFDEAHHLPEIAALFFSTTFSSRQLIELARDSEMESLQNASDQQEIIKLAKNLEQAAFQIRTSFEDTIKKSPWPDKLSQALEKNILEIKKILENLEAELKIAAVRSEGLEKCWLRNGKLIQSFNLLTSPAPENFIHWYELFPQSFMIHLTPTSIGEHFKKYLNNDKKSLIFTSATLTVKNNFSVFVEAMGLEKALQLQLKSPFNYFKQAMMYVPRGLPDPQSSQYTQAVMEAAIPVIQITQGKTFLLFTSYKALDFAANFLKDKIDFPLLVQGSLSKHQLIQSFVNHGNAVLLGTSSFWYGVDVRGDALSCVIIDKLPFASIVDPILQAKIKFMKKKGLDPFQAIQLPQAVLILKQGAGRLIRDLTDKGILMICDPRIVAARYGEFFLQSLPEMPKTREFSKIQEFFTQKEESSAINPI